VTWFGGIVIYVICWWMVLFAVLPWGNSPPETPEPGHATSAPERPRLALKFAVTTGIATVIFLLIWWLMDSGLVSFRQ
jgi:predicted secreted protein